MLHDTHQEINLWERNHPAWVLLAKHKNVGGARFEDSCVNSKRIEWKRERGEGEKSRRGSLSRGWQEPTWMIEVQLWPPPPGWAKGYCVKLAALFFGKRLKRSETMDCPRRTQAMEVKRERSQQRGREVRRLCNQYTSIPSHGQLG